MRSASRAARAARRRSARSPTPCCGEPSASGRRSRPWRRRRCRASARRGRARRGRARATAEHHLLLVAARERRDRARPRGGDDAVARDRLGDHAALVCGVSSMPLLEMRPSRRQREVLARRCGSAAAPQRLRSSGTKPMPRPRRVAAASPSVTSSPATLTLPVRADRAAEREAELGLAGADEPGDADDLAAAHLQARSRSTPSLDSSPSTSSTHSPCSICALAVVVARARGRPSSRRVALACSRQRRVPTRCAVAQHGRAVASA